MTSKFAVAGLSLLLVSTLVSCREADTGTGIATNARIDVSSDPQGANIYLNSSDTHKVTPDLLRDLETGRTYEVLVRTVRNGIVYGFRVPGIRVQPDTLIQIHGPLTMRCSSSTDCTSYITTQTAAGLRFSVVPNGALFYTNGTNTGLYFPSTGVANGYISTGQPLIGMVAGTNNRDTLALGIYDPAYMAGRPAQEFSQTTDRFGLKQSFWTVPPAAVISTLAPTVRGIEVNEELIAVSAQGDVAFVKLTFRNVTNNPAYQAVDPLVGSGGITYSSVYIGFGLDPDIGAATDDAITYDPTQDMVYAYDMDFSEATFGSGQGGQPALVGLKLMEGPGGGSVVALNAWPSQYDWAAGDPSKPEKFGWGVLSGLKPLPGLPDMAGQQIGHIPTTPDDYRISVAAGPLTLAPGADASITVAVILASPVAGTFTSGTLVDPGNAWDGNRQIARIAAGLLQKAKTLTVPQ